MVVIMRHGWKTRIAERIYFEKKMSDREEKIAFRKIMEMKVREDIEEIKRKGMWSHETH